MIQPLGRSACSNEEDSRLRIASEDDLSPFVGWHTGLRVDMLRHPTASRCLQNYLVLTESAERIVGLGLTEAERFWSRYYWLARFSREWQAAVGYDAGLEQQVFQLLEYAPVEDSPLAEVEAAVERDAVRLSPRE